MQMVLGGPPFLNVAQFLLLEAGHQIFVVCTVPILWTFMGITNRWM